MSIPKDTLSIAPYQRNEDQHVVEEEQKPYSLSDLSTDLLLQIFANLSVSDRATVNKVCKKFSHLIPSQPSLAQGTTPPLPRRNFLFLMPVRAPTSMEPKIEEVFSDDGDVATTARSSAKRHSNRSCTKDNDRADDGLHMKKAKQPNLKMTKKK